MAIIQPLDLQELLIGKLAGGPGTGVVIFTILILITLMVLSMRFKIPPIISMGILFIGFIFLATTNPIPLDSPVVFVVIFVFVMLAAIGLGSQFKNWFGG